MNCFECGQQLGPPKPTGRPRRYCSRSCQSRAYRRRQDQGRLTGKSTRLTPQMAAAPLLKMAVTLADNQGISAVTLRQVAHHAETPLVLVQRRFLSRDRLVTAMAQYVLSDQATRYRNFEDARETLLRLAWDEWEAYRAHPWLVTVMASTRPPLAPAVVEVARQYVDAFIALGMDPDIALGRYLALSAYIQGMALLLASEDWGEASSQQPSQAWWLQELSRLNRTGSPESAAWIAEIGSDKMPGANDIDQWFHDGLQRIITGLIAA